MWFNPRDHPSSKHSLVSSYYIMNFVLLKSLARLISVRGQKPSVLEHWNSNKNLFLILNPAVSQSGHSRFVIGYGNCFSTNPLHLPPLHRVSLDVQSWILWSDHLAYLHLFDILIFIHVKCEGEGEGITIRGRSLQLSVWAGQRLLVIKLMDCLYVIIISRPDIWRNIFSRNISYKQKDAVKLNINFLWLLQRMPYIDNY